MAVFREPASFRDPSGHIYRDGSRVLRAIHEVAARDYEHVRDAGLLDRWIGRGLLVPTREVPRTELPSDVPAVHVVEHDPVRFVSYPYEWSFAGLKAAALLHLDLQLDALAHDVALSDASAYNVQFDGARPVFIDLLSLRPYRPGEYWVAQRQFAEQFLNPLLLRALLGVPHNAWYRGSLEGITSADLNALLSARQKLSWNVFSHVTLPARLAAQTAASGRPPAPPQRPLSKAAYHGLLTQLREWIARLSPRAAKTTWGDYDMTHTYAADEQSRKRAAVAAFITRLKPRLVWDVGCNTGEYSELALEAGAGAVVGFEADHGACERAFARAATLTKPFLPLLVDAANASPSQGWNLSERPALASRGPADALIALAVAHHLAIGRNVPLDAVVSWLTAQAPAGVIEFVQKSDPTVQLMLTGREDIFSDYTEDAFRRALASRARIVHVETVSAAERRLFFYER